MVTLDTLLLTFGLLASFLTRTGILAGLQVVVEVSGLTAGKLKYSVCKLTLFKLGSDSGDGLALKNFSLVVLNWVVDLGLGLVT